MIATNERSANLAVDALLKRWNCRPSVGIITGSGFRFPSHGLVQDVVHYREVPGLHTSTVQGHASELQLLHAFNQNVIVCSGRFHQYEGYSDDVCLQLVSLLYRLGIRTLIITNAAGGLHWRYSVGDIALITDTIDFTFQQQVVANHTAATNKARENRALAHKSIIDHCTQAGIALETGTYCQVAGPSYETRAEIRMLRAIGAELVGMSTVRELRYAEALGISTIALSMVTNTLTDAEQRSVTHGEVLEVAANAAGRLTGIINCCLGMEIR